MELFIIMLIIYFVCFFVVLGFQLEKSDSPYIEADFIFFIGVFIVCLISPIALCLILGSKLHGDE